MNRLEVPFGLLMEIEKDIGQKLYVLGSGIRERLFGNEVRRIRIMSFLPNEDIASRFQKVMDSYNISQKEDGSIDVYKHNEYHFVFTQITQPSIEAQLSKIIYTVDALAMTIEDYRDFNKNKIIDPYDGISDIQNKLLRVVDAKNLIEKPIGYLRGIRLMAEHDLDIDPYTEGIMKENAFMLQGISGEEYTKELFRILDQKKSSYYINLMDRHIGMLKYIFPEIEPMKNVGECKYHVVDSFTHSVYTLKVMESVINADGFFEKHLKEVYEDHTNTKLTSNVKRLSLIKLGGFFHDVGKPAAKFIDDMGRTRFRGHDVVGAEMLLKMGERLGLSMYDCKILASYSALHMFPLVIYKNNDVSGNTLYNMFEKTKDETLDVLLIGYADIVATRKLLNPDEEMGNFKVYIEYIANNYITRYLPLKKLDSIISHEEIRSLSGDKDPHQVYDNLKKEIYMGRVDLSKPKIVQYIENLQNDIENL